MSCLRVLSFMDAQVQKKVTAYRETIAGIEVVDAAFADRLLTELNRVMVRHREWREAMAAYHETLSANHRNRLNAARTKYRKARQRAWQVVEEATAAPT